MSYTLQPAVKDNFIKKKTAVVSKMLSKRRQLMCCSCERKSPLFYSLLIPLTPILLLAYFCSQQCRLLWLSAACIIGLWWLLVYSLFPKIVVTIKDIKDIEEFKDIDIDKFENLKLYVDGRCVYHAANANAKNGAAKDNKAWPPPTQFTFHVWKRGEYQLLLVLNNNKSAIETANTYEHAVCNVVFGNKVKGI